MMVFLVGIIGVVTRLRQLFAVRSIAFVEKKQVEGTRLRVKYTYRRRSWSKEAVFHWGLVIALVLPNLLNIYNSYVNDYQMNLFEVAFLSDEQISCFLSPQAKTCI